MNEKDGKTNGDGDKKENILKDYNIKTENLLNNLEKEFIDIGECIKKCLNNYSENKIQLFHDVLEILNQSKNSCYGKMDVKKDIENFVKGILLMEKKKDMVN